MKSKNIFTFAIAMIMILVLSACSNSIKQSDTSVEPPQSAGQIYLYGEVHGIIFEVKT